MKEIHEKIRSKYDVDLHIDTLWKAKKHGASKKLAKMLEGVTGIPRLQFLYPDEYGNPWEKLH